MASFGRSVEKSGTLLEGDPALAKPRQLTIVSSAHFSGMKRALKAMPRPLLSSDLTELRGCKQVRSDGIRWRTIANISKRLCSSCPAQSPSAVHIITLWQAVNVLLRKVGHC